MENIVYVVSIKGGMDMQPEQKKALRTKIESVEGKEVWGKLRFRNKVEASRRAHWIQSTSGVPMEVVEVYPVTFNIF